MNRPRLLTTLALAAVALTGTCTLGACDDPDPTPCVCDDEVTPRLFPYTIELKATVSTPLKAADLLGCYKGDENPAEIFYADGPAADIDDKKPITLTVKSKGHEDVAECFRQVLVQKMGAKEPDDP